jgi:glycosyltransferase involved in cell wall biosynthesis
LRGAEETLRGWTEEGVTEWWGRREDMPRVMAESHVVCLPSKYGEGVPKVLLEAAAAGHPVVATDTPGCREVIEDGVEGLLVPAGDSVALAAALRRLIEGPEAREAMGAAGRARAIRDLDVDQVVTRTSGTYEVLRALGNAA